MYRKLKLMFTAGETDILIGASSASCLHSFLHMNYIQTNLGCEIAIPGGERASAVSGPTEESAAMWENMLSAGKQDKQIDHTLDAAG